MPESANTSFIPKRNPIKGSRNNAPRPIFIGTLLIRVFFFAVLIATVAVFAYQDKLNKDLDKEIVALNDAISSFSEERMQKILDIDNRLNQTRKRLNHTVSMYSLMDTLEASTLGTVRINNMEVKRLDDKNLTIEAEMRTDSFDSVLFQRGIIERDEKLSVTKYEDLTVNNPASSVVSAQARQQIDPQDTRFSVSFKAELAVDASLIPHRTPAQLGMSPQPAATETIMSEEEIFIEDDFGSSDTSSNPINNQ